MSRTPFFVLGPEGFYLFSPVILWPTRDVCFLSPAISWDMRSLLELEQLIFKEGVGKFKVARYSITFSFWVYFVNYRLVVLAFFYSTMTLVATFFFARLNRSKWSPDAIFIFLILCAYIVFHFSFYTHYPCTSWVMMIPRNRQYIISKILYITLSVFGYPI